MYTAQILTDPLTMGWQRATHITMRSFGFLAVRLLVRDVVTSDRDPPFSTAAYVVVMRDLWVGRRELDHDLPPSTEGSRVAPRSNVPRVFLFFH